MKGRTNKNIRLVAVGLLTSSLLVLGCTSRNESPSRVAESSPSKQWVRDGSIVISRAVPAVSAENPVGVLGFLPLTGTLKGHWLSINLADQKLKFMEGDKVLSETPWQGSLQGKSLIKPGTFKLVHKQRNPLWYAPDSYFTKRHLALPSQNDRARFRRGALGEFALFLDKETPIHSGPIWTEDIGGIRIDEHVLSRIYYQLEIGAPIEVQG